MYAFVLPDTTIGSTTEKVILKQGADATGFEVSGTLAEAQRDVFAYCIGNSRLLHVISTAFAAPLLGILNKEGGGFHFVGESSQGKTTLSYVGASVIGNPDSTIKPMNATANSFEGEAANCNDSTMFLDELGEAPPEQIGGIVYKLAGGKGRGRADQHGNAKARNTWRILFITTGETDLESMMKTANRRTFAGQSLRLANIPADAGTGHGVYETLHSFPSGAALSENFRKVTQMQHGTAFREYMTKLVTDLNANETGLHDRLNAYIKNFLHDTVPPGADGQVYRVASRFALVAAGGELASYYGVTRWPEGDAAWGAHTCFNAWLEQRGGIGQAEVSKLLDQIEAFFDRNGENCFVALDGEDRANNRPVVDRYGFRRRVSVAASDETRTEYFVLASRFREICTGFDHRWAAKQLAEKGIIKKGADGKNSVTRQLPDIGGKARCYHFYPGVDSSGLPESIPF